MNLSELEAAATPEMQLALRFERIFMPEVRRQRNAFYEANPDPRFVHYTRAEAALEIIRKKRLWLRNATAMIDYREVEHGYELLWKWFNDEGNRAKFHATFDAIHAGAAHEAVDKFDATWNRTDLGVRLHSYIASVSEHDPSENGHGRLSMWRAFGADASARVALVFKVQPLSGAAQYLKCLFSPVAYLDKGGLNGIMFEVLANVEKEGDFLRAVSRDQFINLIFFTLVVATICVKHEGFKEEREWRIVYLPGFYPTVDPPRIESEVLTIGGVPQTIYKFPLDAKVAPEIADLDVAAMFDRLIIGPTRYPIVLHDAFRKTLEQAGVADAGSRIIASTIPIRS